MSITVRDNTMPQGLIDAALATWPDERWPHWHLYSGEYGVKRASKDPERLPAPCRILVERMAAIDIPGCFPDLDLHGAGMHWIPSGGRLSRHIDSNIHPLTGWRRRANTILFLEGCGGGELKIMGQLITPKSGRTVHFDCGEDCWHEVLPVESGNRRTLSLFWWDHGTVEQERLAAQFA